MLTAYYTESDLADAKSMAKHRRLADRVFWLFTMAMGLAMVYFSVIMADMTWNVPHFVRVFGTFAGAGGVMVTFLSLAGFCNIE